MIEEYSARCMKVAGLTVISGQVIAGNLRNTVSVARVKLSFFVLRRDRRLAKHLTGAGEIETGMRGNFAHTGKQVVGSVNVCIDRRKFVFEGITDQALSSSQVIHLIRLNMRQRLVEAGITLQ